jgi:hypothetical protein
MFAAAAALLAAVAGCAAPSEDAETNPHETMACATAGTNGLTGVDGLTGIDGITNVNGLIGVNGLGGVDGLDTRAGLAPTHGLMTTAAGRKTVEYLVRCALPSGRRITKQDQYNATHVFSGQLGMYPSWEWGACDVQCQEHITSCMLAHINTTGHNIPIWLDSPNPAIGWGRSPSYPHQEGSFFGNIFTTPPRAYYCGGPGFGTNVVPSRIGATRVAAAYVNPFGWAGAQCPLPGPGIDSSCVNADYPNSGDGYKACAGYNHVMTVWRR